MAARRRLFSLLAIPLVFGSSLAVAAERGTDGIGFYTAMLGQVSVTHSNEDRALPVTLHSEVLFKDIIQTQSESRTRALFEDDSMLTVGENSRVEIDEYIYNPEKNVRQAIVKLMQGQVRALVSKVFKANGSRFEIHTPSAVAAARGTYFTVWVENKQSGIINIGEKGRVDFTSGGKTVAVDPGYFSIAQEGQAPSMPLPHQLGQNGHDQSNATTRSTEKIASAPVVIHYQGSTVTSPIKNPELTLAPSPAGLTRALAAVELTALREAPLVELPAQVLQALNLEARLMKTLTILTAGTTGTLTTGPLTTGSVATATTGSVSVGSASVAPVTSALAAPVTPIISAVVAPVAPIISPIVAPVAPIISAVVAPVAPIISPVVAPVTPLVTPILALPLGLPTVP